MARPLNSPGPVQRPHPPILLAGGGEKKTLRLVAQYADACHLPAHAAPVAGIDLGADHRSGRRDFLATLRGLATLGFSHAIVAPRGPWSADGLAALAEITGDIHAIEAAG